MCDNLQNQYIAICNNGSFLDFLTNKMYCSYPLPNCQNYIVYCMNDDFAHSNIAKYDPHDRVRVTVDMDQCVRIVTQIVVAEYFKITGSWL